MDRAFSSVSQAHSPPRGLSSIFAVLLLAIAGPQVVRAAPRLQLATPESVGFSTDRLKRMDAVMRRVVDEKQYAGVVTLVARHGKVVHFSAIGQKDMASAAPMNRDDLFRVFSISKPVTAAAMMILYEEGRWTVQDPIVRFIPEWRNLKVYAGVSPTGAMMLEDPVHPPVMRELMTMTAGLSYGGDQNPAERSYQDEKGRNIFLAGSLQAMIERLARAPLLYQPSASWKYSLSVDVQGYIIEKLTGMTLPQFMKQRLFDPLKMKDTAFYVTPDELPRLATLYKMDEGGKLVQTDPPEWNTHLKEPTLPQGGAGLVSTAEDYFRFGQMLLNGGELDGVRVLGPETVKLMMSNHLAPQLMAETRGGGYEFTKPRPGLGYGFDGAVVTDPGLAGFPVGAGTYFWDGAPGTWFWVDPANDIVVVGMTQRLGWGIQDSVPGLPPNLEQLSMGVIYQALIEPKR
jgi:CubicO group peptidase (beta-lactamase class C family)